MAGIKEVKEVVEFGISLANALGASLEDGKIGFDDLTRFFEAIGKVPAAFTGLAEVPVELKDLTVEEIDELHAFVMEKFDIPQDKVELIVECALDLVMNIWDFVQLFKPEPTAPV